MNRILDLPYMNYNNLLSNIAKEVVCVVIMVFLHQGHDRTLFIKGPLQYRLEKTVG